MTIRNLYPSRRPRQIYNVINGRTEPPVGAIYIQPQETYYYANDLSLKKAAPNEPRFNYDPITGDLDGLLLEGEVMNNIENSNRFENTNDQTVVPNTDKTLAPDGTQTASEGTFGAAFANYNEGKGVWGINSVFVKKGTANFIAIYYGGVGFNNSNQGPSSRGFCVIDMRDGTFERDGYGGRRPYRIVKLANGWYQVYAKYITSSSYSGTKGGCFTLTDDIEGKAESLDTSSDLQDYYYHEGTVYVWGQSYNNIPAETQDRIELPPMYLATNGEAVTKPADKFAITSPGNFDNGFSLLLDSETTTQDFIYKVRVNNDLSNDDSVCSVLRNNNGTLDWNINGKSASINNEYPQVGFSYGRVRTISAFGQAGVGDVANYLYTTGLSFPTVAAPCTLTNTLELGAPQVVKAIYQWDGQLSARNATSVIKGQYNEVPLEPIDIEAYSFIYDTDPKDVGNTKVELPKIIPTTSMTIDWGDGQRGDVFEKGILPTHTYPYPGSYRIQIDPADEFEQVTIGSKSNYVVKKIDQWAPQHRVDAPGGGFGDDLSGLLQDQQECTEIPDFKYSNIVTGLLTTFQLCVNLKPKGPNNEKAWSWVPTQLPDCIRIHTAFSYLSYVVSSDEEKASFPQLVTSNKLESLEQAYNGSQLTGFATEDGSPTTQPLTDTSGVTTWSYAFSSNHLPEITIDTSSGIIMNNLFPVNAFTTGPNMVTTNATNIAGMFQSCQQLTSTPLYDFSNVKIANNLFYQCDLLQECKLWNWSNVENLQSAYQLTRVTQVPAWKLPKITNMNSCFANAKVSQIDSNFEPGPNLVNCARMFRGCQLETFPDIDMGAVRDFYECFMSFKGTIFPALNIGERVTEGQKINFQSMFASAVNLESMPMIDTSRVNNFAGAFQNCYALTTFPAWDISNGKNFNSMFANCSTLASFGFDLSTVSAKENDNIFAVMFTGCALTVEATEQAMTQLDANGLTDCAFGIDGGTNPDRADWTEATETAYQNLLAKGWTITINETGRSAQASSSGFYVFHDGGDHVHWGAQDGSVIDTGLPNKESFDDEHAAVSRVMALKPSVIPEWDRELTYYAGDYVQVRGVVFRALTEIDNTEFMLPDLIMNRFAEIPTPLNRQARWLPVYSKLSEELEQEPAALLVDKQPKRRRARNADGTFKADDPSTPDVNEAWQYGW